MIVLRRREGIQLLAHIYGKQIDNFASDSVRVELSTATTDSRVTAVPSNGGTRQYTLDGESVSSQNAKTGRIVGQ